MNGELSVICPLTLERTTVNALAPRCECCDEALPPLYLEEGHNMLPLAIQFFGLSRHGKTAYLAALTIALQRMNAVWNGFTATPAAESSWRTVRAANLYYATGHLPPATPPGIKDSFLLLLRRIPRWGNAALMIRDCPGAAFRDCGVDLQEASFLLRGQLVMMFISLENFEHGYTMDALMNNYLTSLVAQGVRLEAEFKKVVVVLTKADLLLDRLPADLLHYIREDPVWQVAREEVEPKWYSAPDMDAYLKTMDDTSKIVEQWICRQAAARTLVTLARDRNVEVQFSLVSATGSAPRNQDNTLPTGWEPSRVLDPFLWALELAGRRRREIGGRAAAS